MAISENLSPPVEIVKTQKLDQPTSATIRSYFELKYVIIGILLILAYVIPVRWYQGWAAFWFRP